MRRVEFFFALAMVVLVLAAGCGESHRTHRGTMFEGEIVAGTVLKKVNLDPVLEGRILGLDPDRVSGKDVEEVLSRASAPRIINIHGGIYPVYLVMHSFSEFLIGMGYPESKISNPRDGSYSYSCYGSSRELAGYIAWFYERDGLRPMMVGHSQGGIQVVKVLHELAGTFDASVQVWNPITESPEERDVIIDPLTGRVRPVVGLEVSFASAIGSGGLTRFLPNQWIMAGRLRTIPDSAVEFCGFSMGFDLLGGDFMGFGPSNRYEANGRASVRNVRLPASYSHVFVPTTSHLAESAETRDWINNYVPTEEPELSREFEAPSANILLAADVWHSIKKHWVLELQRFVRAKRGLGHDR